MGDSEEGGGGSVEWKLEAKNASKAKHGHEKKNDKQEITQEGKDEGGAIGTDFTVSIQVPNGLTRDDFLDHLRSPSGLKPSKEDDRVYFNLPIERERPKQIRVSWGDSSYHEDNGGKPTKPPFPTTFRSS